MKDIQHGTTTGYTRGCRCNECRAASAEYQRKRKKAQREGTWDDRTPYRTQRQQCTGPECERLARYLEPQPLCGGHVQQVWRGVPLKPLRKHRKTVDGLRECSRCGEVKPIDEFYMQSGTKRQSACKVCSSIINRVNRYGLSFDRVKEMVSAFCEACGSTENLHIDHCHDSGVVRGVLCHNCNTVLTKHMTPEILRRLASYLEGSLLF